MHLLGAHQSIAGGHHKAVEIGVQTGCNVLQVFTKNNNQWKGKAITPGDVTLFRNALAAAKINCPLAHNSYLINLAAPDDVLWKKSIDAMVDEIQRADMLGIPWVVAHPGAFTTSSEEVGIKRIIQGLNEVLSQTKKLAAGCLMETTAGQGSHLGWRFEHLAAIIEGVKSPERVGVCFDTCHVFAAGYKVKEKKEYQATMREFDKIVGVEQIRAFHLNDSLKDCGSRVDRHAHIGEGKMGLDPFRWLLGDKRFKTVPMVLETPKEEVAGEEGDIVNLRTLRGLV
jgi:deoxyribonuclease-4